MSKLWAKGYELNAIVETFMTGKDPLLDLHIARYDCIASVAHATMLTAIGILTPVELVQIETALDQIQKQIEHNQFTIAETDEDIHTAIENELIRRIGEAGKKIHTGRSRNDQVLTALRLYKKAEIEKTMTVAIETAQLLVHFATANSDIPYVGRTHYQKAMPSSMGLWAGAFAESMVDNIQLLKDTHSLIDQCPLGSGASYGVSIDLDRQQTSDLLGFKKVQNNVLYANNSRGKFESIVIHALAQVMNDLAKLSSDIIFFSIPETGYLELPQEFCPGSSLMPNKKNPDPFELIRAKTATVYGYLLQTLEIGRGLPSGYHRDFQETKAPLIDSFEIVKGCLSVVNIIVPKIVVNEANCLKAFTNDVFATDATLRSVKQGVSFRTAYQHTASTLAHVANEDPHQNILSKKHLGATGNLGLGHIKKQIDRLKNELLTMNAFNKK